MTEEEIKALTDRFPEYDEWKRRSKKPEHPYYVYPETDYPLMDADGNEIREEDIMDNRPPGPWPEKIPITFFGFKNFIPKEDIIETI